jgi:ribosomal protein S18 acetylase RimI-like enzyme
VLSRPCHPADFPALYAIEEACFDPLLRFSKSYMRQLLRRKDTAAWITEADGRMAGFAIIGWNTVSGIVLAYIETIEVLPALRGQGIGRELLRCLESSAVSADAGAILLHVEEGNAVAIRMYESFGYRYVNREEGFYPLGRAALIYRKSL